MSSLGAWLVQRSVASWDWLLVLAESWVGALSWWSRLWEAIAATPPCLYAFIIWHSLFIDHNELPTLHGKLPLKLCNLKISLSLAVTETVSYSTLCAFIVVHILFLVIYSFSPHGRRLVSDWMSCAMGKARAQPICWGSFTMRRPRGDWERRMRRKTF